MQQPLRVRLARKAAQLDRPAAAPVRTRRIRRPRSPPPIWGRRSRFQAAPRTLALSASLPWARSRRSMRPPRSIRRARVAPAASPGADGSALAPRGAAPSPWRRRHAPDALDPAARVPRAGGSRRRAAAPHRRPAVEVSPCWLRGRPRHCGWNSEDRPRAAAAARVSGPESNSGTISTMSATKIVAPIRRSLTRRSMSSLAVFMSSKAAQYIREDSAAAEAPRLEPIHRRTDGMERAEDHDSIGGRLRPPGRGAGSSHVARRRGAAPSRTARSAPPIRRRCVPRAPSVEASHHSSKQPASRSATPAASLSARMPQTASVLPARGSARKLLASTAAASGLWATSRITVGPADSITWKRADEARRGQSSGHRLGRQLEARREFLECRDRGGRVRELRLPEKRRRRQARQISSAARDSASDPRRARSRIHVPGA